MRSGARFAYFIPVEGAAKNMNEGALHQIGGKVGAGHFLAQTATLPAMVAGIQIGNRIVGGCEAQTRLREREGFSRWLADGMAWLTKQ